MHTSCFTFLILLSLNKVCFTVHCTDNGKLCHCQSQYSTPGRYAILSLNKVCFTVHWTDNGKLCHCQSQCSTPGRYAIRYAERCTHFCRVSYQQCWFVISSMFCKLPYPKRCITKTLHLRLLVPDFPLFWRQISHLTISSLPPRWLVDEDLSKFPTRTDAVQNFHIVHTTKSIQGCVFFFT